MEKELKIIPPEGYEIDKENSTFECVKFKPIAKRWRDKESAPVRGFYIHNYANICEFEGENKSYNHNVFVTEKQAKSALAMAQISQIMANDERFGGPITDEEWENMYLEKYVIHRIYNKWTYTDTFGLYGFLAFHTQEQRDLFLKENEDLIKDYLMIG